MFRAVHGRPVCVVCGQALPSAAPVRFIVWFQGAARAFCGADCRLRFKREPERWVPAAAPTPERPGPPTRPPSPFVVRMAPGNRDERRPSR